MSKRSEAPVRAGASPCPADLLEGDWTASAESFTALGHPVRLRLLGEILGGRRTAAELTELDELGTTGQIYHHLRQLTGTGRLHTTGRGRHEVPPGGSSRCSWRRRRHVRRSDSAGGQDVRTQARDGGLPGTAAGLHRPGGRPPLIFEAPPRRRPPGLG